MTEPVGFEARARRLAIRFDIALWSLATVFFHGPAKLWNSITPTKLIFVLGAAVVGCAACWLWFVLLMRSRRAGGFWPLIAWGAGVVLLVLGFNMGAAAVADALSNLRLVRNGETQVMPLSVWVVNTWIVVGWAPLVFAAGVAAMLAVFAIEERDRRLAQAQALAREAQLATLRLQINPAFLFNALGAISELVDKGRKDDAELLVGRLSDLFRTALAETPGELTSLDEEMDAAGAYLAVEQLRSAVGLFVDIDLPDELRSAQAPRLLLQPAMDDLAHELETTREQVKVKLSAERQGAALILMLEDTLQTAARPGARRMAERLGHLYGDAAALIFESGPEGGRLRVELPLQLSD